MPDTQTRRPLKTRASRWAQTTAKILLKIGASPNGISVCSLIFACIAAACLYYSNRYGNWLWIGAALGIQLRLLCNLLDGMLAVEGGLGTPDGELYNEVPDRIADVLILVSAGYVSLHPAGEFIGWLAATAALLTAYARVQGAALTGEHDFCGPMAKPHRMALLTGLCLLMGIGGMAGLKEEVLGDIYFWTLTLIAFGTLFTFCKRIVRLSKKLKSQV